MKKILFFSFLGLVIAISWLACTIKIDTGQPVINVNCIVIELPGGKVDVICPDAATMDAE